MKRCELLIYPPNQPHPDSLTHQIPNFLPSLPPQLSFTPAQPPAPAVERTPIPVGSCRQSLAFSRLLQAPAAPKSCCNIHQGVNHSEGLTQTTMGGKEYRCIQGSVEELKVVILRNCVVVHSALEYKGIGYKIASISSGGILDYADRGINDLTDVYEFRYLRCGSGFWEFTRVL
ncbi:hypothetical protein V6N13_050374 [Hibiscus sabdariffa]